MNNFGCTDLGFIFDYRWFSNNCYFPVFDFSSYTFPVIQFPPIDFSKLFQNIWSFNAYPFAAQTPSTSIYEQQQQKKDNDKVNDNDNIGDSFTRTAQSSVSNTNLSGYDSKAGEKLAKTALRQSVGFTGYCAKYVKNAVQDAGLGNYEYGHAYQMPSILRRNKNFKELSTNVDVSSLPAGCILVYDKGSAGYSKEYGHTEITTGDGRAVSDGITENLYKKPSAIFMPVEKEYLA